MNIRIHTYTYIYIHICIHLPEILICFGNNKIFGVWSNSPNLVVTNCFTALFSKNLIVQIHSLYDFSLPGP